MPIGIVTVLLGPLLPVLSARWSLNYSHAGRLIIVQYVSSTCAVALSGALAARWGHRFAIKSGLMLIAAGLLLLMAGPQPLAFSGIAAYGFGLGIAVPAGNLIVAELNPDRRSATLNWLNFAWSAGAVTCPFLVAAAVKSNRVPLLLSVIAGVIIFVEVIFVLLPAHNVELKLSVPQSEKAVQTIQQRPQIFFLLAAIFLLYVGTENSLGLWTASYARTFLNSKTALPLIAPSFFYAALTFGRWLAPFLLPVGEIKLIRIGLLLGCVGSTALIFSSSLIGLAISASATGLGLSYVYPITISFLSREFRANSSQIASVMFVLSNVGGGVFPWIVGVFSTRFGTLQAGLGVPLLGCAAMLALYSIKYWNEPTSEQA